MSKPVTWPNVVILLSCFIASTSPNTCDELVSQLTKRNDETIGSLYPILQQLQETINNLDSEHVRIMTTLDSAKRESCSELAADMAFLFTEIQSQLTQTGQKNNDMTDYINRMNSFLEEIKTQTLTLGVHLNKGLTNAQRYETIGQEIVNNYMLLNETNRELINLTNSEIIILNDINAAFGLFSNEHSSIEGLIGTLQETMLMIFVEIQAISFNLTTLSSDISFMSQGFQSIAKNISNINIIQQRIDQKQILINDLVNSIDIVTKKRSPKTKMVDILHPKDFKYRIKSTVKGIKCNKMKEASNYMNFNGNSIHFLRPVMVTFGGNGIAMVRKNKEELISSIELSSGMRFNSGDKLALVGEASYLITSINDHKEEL